MHEDAAQDHAYVDPKTAYPCARNNDAAVDLAGTGMTCAPLRFPRLGKGFIDFPGLVMVDGEWRIISQVFRFEPAVPTAWHPRRT